MEDEEYIPEEYNSNEEEPSEQYISSSGSEDIENRPTMDNFFAFEEMILNIDRTMRGGEQRAGKWIYNPNNAIARDSFISKMINGIRSIVNPGNFNADIDKTEVNRILDEKNTQFIYDVHDEPTISEADVEAVINIHDHILELFLKTVRDGVGNQTVRQLNAGVVSDLTKTNQQNRPIIDLSAIGGNK